jgi:hypothetical protein
VRKTITGRGSRNITQENPEARNKIWWHSLSGTSPMGLKTEAGSSARENLLRKTRTDRCRPGCALLAVQATGMNMNRRTSWAGHRCALALWSGTRSKKNTPTNQPRTTKTKTRQSSTEQETQHRNQRPSSKIRFRTTKSNDQK